METIIKNKTKREIVVGNHRIVQSRVGKKEVWVFNLLTNESVAMKDTDFEKGIRSMCKNHLSTNGGLNGADIFD